MGAGAQGGAAGAAGGGLVVGLLGPVEVASAAGGLAGVARPMLRVLVAMLGVAPGRVVPVEALVDGLWGEEWSRERAQNLHTHVSALRRLLAAAELGQGGPWVVRSGGGYRLMAAEAEVDAGLFRFLAGQGRAAARAGNVTGAAGLFGQALGLWRGAALADVVGLCPRLAGDAAGLEEQRAGVVEERLECDLALGQHAEVAADGPGLIAEFPLRERLAGQLMVALYRCGRRGEALAVFDTTRRALAEQLGLDPGPQLAQIQAKVLADDPTLTAPLPAAASVLAPADAPAGSGDGSTGVDGPAGPGKVVVPRQLPVGVGSFAGREGELKALDELAGARHNLPASLTSFLGRDHDLAELERLLGQVRLVTVTGPGGVGKTRLAGEVARQVTGRFADGVWLAELAAVTDPAQVAQVVAVALGVREQPGVPAAEALAQALARQQLLLVLDNCEHVIGAAAELCAGLVAAADDVRILATSRERLRVPGEAAYRLGPLALPGSDDAAGGGGSEAVALFVDRARRADAHFAPTGETGPVVERLVARLDGMPLAIELAAARVEALGVAGLARRIEDRFALLVAGDRLAAGRQQSLAATVEWSYRLLDEAERRVFRQVSVFAGPFTLEAAEAVAGAGAAAVVARLVDCSLLAPPREGPDGRARYLMLETLRAYGAALLEEAGELEEATAALAGYALQVAGQAAAGLATVRGELAAARWLDAEDATMRQVLAWADEHDRATGLRIAVALGWWRFLRGRLAGEYPHLREAAEHAEMGSQDWCAAQFWLGWTAVFSYDAAAALGHFTALRDAVEHRPPSRALAEALTGRAAALRMLGQIPEWVAEARRSLALARELGYPAMEAQELGELSYAALEDGDLDSAVRLARQADQISGEMPGPLARIPSMVLTDTLTAAGDLAAARRVCVAALAASREVGDLWYQPYLLARMAILDLQAGRTGDAAAHLNDAIQIGVRPGLRANLPDAVDWCGHLCAQTGRPAEAVTLWAAHAAMLRRAGVTELAADERTRHEPLRQARHALGPDRARAAEERGAAMSLDTAADYALMLTTPGPQPPAADSGTAKLSARERDLVTLVAQGRTDAQIAAQLYISTHTVSSHLDQIRDKTGYRRRADLTRLALAAGLI